MTAHTPEKIKYAAEIDNVREVILTGRASLSFWKELLSPKGLYPADYDGYAEITISATDLKWKAIKFNEFVVNIAVSGEENSSPLTGYYLIQGFNSVRLLALSERLFFSTPYYWGKIFIQDRVPLEIILKLNEETVFKAGMISETIEHTSGPEEWTGPIFLPTESKSRKRYFIASLSGETKRYTFSIMENTLSINTVREYPVFSWLTQSDYEPLEWRVRDNALHKKSRTYRRYGNG
jgi:hypothetical protein